MQLKLLAAIIGAFLCIQAILGWKPSVFAGLYVYLPLLGIALIAMHLAARNVSARSQTERQTWLLAVFSAAVLGVGVGIVGGGNDGSASTVLPPAQIGISIATGGFLPWKMGMVNMLRFLPLMTALSCAWFAIKRGVPTVRIMLVCIAMYLGISIIWHLPSIAALVLRQTGMPIETTQDAYIVLIRAMTNTFWANDLGNRFLSPIAEQGRSGLSVFHAALCVLTAGFIAFGLKIKDLLRKKSLEKTSLWNGGAMLLIGLCALMLGQSVQVMPKLTPITVLVHIVFCLWVISGIFWLNEENKSVEDQEMSDEPSPMMYVFVGSSLVLGWPVFLGCVLGLIASFLRKELHLEGMLGEDGAKRMVVLSTGIGLGWGALCVGLQDITPLTWMIRLIIGFALIAAYVVTQKADSVRSAVESSLSIGFGALLSGQGIIGLAALPAIISIWIIESREKSHKWRFLPPLVFALWYAFCLLFFPSAFSRA